VIITTLGKQQKEKEIDVRSHAIKISVASNFAVDSHTLITPSTTYLRLKSNILKKP
jgi:hypothetical protein